jgi:hypothetical protein
MTDASSRTPHEEFISLLHRLQALFARYPDRKDLVAAAHYGMLRATICRGLRRHLHPSPRSARQGGRQPLSQAVRLRP